MTVVAVDDDPETCHRGGDQGVVTVAGTTGVRKDEAMIGIHDVVMILVIGILHVDVQIHVTDGILVGVMTHVTDPHGDEMILVIGLVTAVRNDGQQIGIVHHSETTFLRRMAILVLPDR